MVSKDIEAFSKWNLKQSFEVYLDGESLVCGRTAFFSIFYCCRRLKEGRILFINTTPSSSTKHKTFIEDYYAMEIYLLYFVPCDTCLLCSSMLERWKGYWIISLYGGDLLWMKVIASILIRDHFTIGN